jgi:hypothetical protein
VWLDGYSDHLPTVVYLVKEQTMKKSEPKESVFALPEYTEAERKNIASCEAEKKLLEEKDH